MRFRNVATDRRVGHGLTPTASFAGMPQPTRSDPGIGTCDPVLYTSTDRSRPHGDRRALPDPGYPFVDLGDATCTAHLTVANGETLDVALYDVPVDDLAAQSRSRSPPTDGWVRDADAPVWRDGDHVIRAIEIEEGVPSSSTPRPSTTGSRVSRRLRQTVPPAAVSVPPWDRMRC